MYFDISTIIFIMQDNKQRLQKVLASVIRKNRKSCNKSMSLLSNEIMLAKSLWSDLEKGKKDPQFSTLWRIAEGLEIPLSLLIKEVEDRLNGSVSFIDDEKNL